MLWWKKKTRLSLSHCFLGCKRFSGRRTGQHIASTFESELQSVGIKDKIEYIVTDNAANLQGSFLTAFPDERSKQSDPKSDLLDENQNREDFLEHRNRN